MGLPLARGEEWVDGEEVPVVGGSILATLKWALPFHPCTPLPAAQAAHLGSACSNPTRRLLDLRWARGASWPTSDLDGRTWTALLQMKPLSPVADGVFRIRGAGQQILARCGPLPIQAASHNLQERAVLPREELTLVEEEAPKIRWATRMGRESVQAAQPILRLVASRFCPR
jgi:hypothetical protein